MNEQNLTKVSFPQYSRYDEFIDKAGNKFYRDKVTKEWVPCINVDMPVGGKVLTPKQVEAQDQYVERAKQLEVEKRTRECNRRLSFYFVRSKDRKQEAIKPYNLARVFFLATYLRDGDSRLYATDGTPLKKSDLAELMKLGDSAFKAFWRDTNGKYLFQEEDKTIKISNEFIRGSLSVQCQTSGTKNECQQIFIKTLRELYFQTDIRKHGYLGYLFMILHQVNYEYNILCWNPAEKDRDKIEVMTLDDFCRNMGAGGYTANQRKRLLDAYRKLTFEINGTKQYLVAYLEDYVSKRFYLVVNPNILYRGSSREKVDGFGSFFPNLTAL